MRIVLSNHALLRAQQRGVSFEQIIDCISNPDQVSDEPDGKKCFKKIQLDKMLMLCYTVDEDESIRVITVILTSKIKKYLN